MKNSIALQKWEIPYCAVLILLLVVLGLLLVPMFILACYDVPAADDFSFSCETHAAFLNGGGIRGMIAGAAYKTAEVYNTWQGSFSAIFLMAFQPSVWGFHFYRLTTYIMVVPLVSSIFLLSHRVFSGIFSLRKSLSGIIAAFAAIICTQFLPAANQAFYWYNGSVYYTFTFSFVLFFFACMIAYLLRGKKMEAYSTRTDGDRDRRE